MQYLITSSFHLVLPVRRGVASPPPRAVSFCRVLFFYENEGLHGRFERKQHLVDPPIVAELKLDERRPELVGLESIVVVVL